MNCEMIEHGRTGLLCETAEQWSAAIAQLADDPALRRTMGAAAREAVTRRYGVAHWSPQLARIVDRLGRAAAVPNSSADGGTPNRIAPFAAAAERIA